MREANNPVVQHDIFLLLHGRPFLSVSRRLEITSCRGVRRSAKTSRTKVTEIFHAALNPAARLPRP